MRLLRRFSKRRNFRQAIAYFLICCMLCSNMPPSVALAGPEGAQVVNGQVSFEQSGYNTAITASDKAIINYSSFDIARPEIVEFIQPGSTASVLNRILSANPTNIDGTLLANGRVFFVNPAGVYFGSGATINVNQLVASALDISNSDFINGRYNFVGGDGSVINNGDISAEAVYLIGKQVANAGSISCPAGYVVMAAGDRVFLGEPGSDLVLEIDAPAISELAVLNEGTVDASGGTIVLAAGDIFSQAIANVGTLSAEGGTVTMKAARVNQSGTINVDGVEGDGGNVALTAREVVTLGSESLTTANAGANGNGGEVIVLADDMAIFSEGARIEAKGGTESGDGGFVEISGAHFIFDGDVDASATNGELGTLLIDPVSITIKNGSGTTTPDTYWEKQLEDQAASINLLADEFIIMENLEDDMLDLRDDGKSIVLKTGPDGFISIHETDTIATTTGDITIEGGSGGIEIGSLQTGHPNTDNPGLISLIASNTGDITTKNLKVTGRGTGKVTVNTDGNVTINGDILVRTNNVPNREDAAAVISVTAGKGKDLVINGDVEAWAHGRTASNAEIELRACQDVTVNGNLTARAQPPASDGDDGIGKATASIEIAASRNVTITGESIQAWAHTANSQEAEATADIQIHAYLGSVTINSEETRAWAKTAHSEEAKATADIEIHACEDVTINGNLKAWANTAEPHWGKATATIEVLASGDIYLNGDEYPQARADRAKVQSNTSDTDVDGEDTATIIINHDAACPPRPGECPGNGGGEEKYPPIADDDGYSVDQGETLYVPKEIGIFDGDYDPDGDDFSLDSHTLLASGRGTLILEEEDGSFTYIPPDDLDDADFDEYGQWQDTFTYLIIDSDGKVSETPATVTITVYKRESNGPWPPQYIPAAPLPRTIVWEVSGCPALTEWLAGELGVEADKLQFHLLHAFSDAEGAVGNKTSIAYMGDVQWCQMCARLKDAAGIVDDMKAGRAAALANVITNELAGPLTGPPSPEQMATIATALAGAVGGLEYASATELIDAIVAYVGILTDELGLGAGDAIALLMEKHGAGITEDESVALYIGAHLASLGGE